MFEASCFRTASSPCALCLFVHSHPNGCKVVSHYGFICNSLTTNDLISFSVEHGCNIQYNEKLTLTFEMKMWDTGNILFAMPPPDFRPCPWKDAFTLLCPWVNCQGKERVVLRVWTPVSAYYLIPDPTKRIYCTLQIVIFFFSFVLRQYLCSGSPRAWDVLTPYHRREHPGTRDFSQGAA